MSLTHAHTGTFWRRSMLTVTAGVAALALLTGCAAGGSADESTATGGETIDFSYEGYEATLPAEPERVVVLDSRAGLEMALLADYPIVATAYGVDSPLSPLVSADSAHLKNTAFDLNREEIASYNPDLIVVGIGWYNYYKDEGFGLDEIAPVLAVNDGIDVEGASADDPFVSMTDQLTLLDRADKAEDAIAGYEKAVEDAKKKIGAYTDGKTASVIHAPVDNFTVITEDSIYRVVLPALGFTILENEEISSAPRNQQNHGHMLSYESAVSALGDADVLFVYKAERDADLDPLLARVPAVAAGHWIDGNLAERFGFALTYTSFVNGIVDSVSSFDNF
ncbi:ABC transporter substrate-binding protein [Leucobacter sp. UT-8R-CII-1-4]|uniref:ABC transporter substrate-binding protein n=1 Tax=Leucobacter sp. UT-8R-CII-1-4 TaxID=3040075 RepID=UPI0024A7ADAD|nr:ABC transporter substrate-binding protein [Leucobacter sp. UT-8R-CII-1-4]MDI6022387.1 ABC transporter substrate-binding protein [Leucobacter sp. UT-8R-CII-1-4]